MTITMIIKIIIVMTINLTGTSQNEKLNRGKMLDFLDWNLRSVDLASASGLKSLGFSFLSKRPKSF